MANALVTLKARNKMLRARAGEIRLPKIVGFAFGDGGVDATGTPIPPLEEQEFLKNELFRKKIDRYKMLSLTQCRYTCTLLHTELVGKNISEIALYDEDGDLIAIKTFRAKGKDDDLEMEFQLDDTF